MELDDVIKNVQTCQNKPLGNTVCCTDCRNTFHTVIMQYALIYIALLHNYKYLILLMNEQWKRVRYEKR